MNERKRRVLDFEARLAEAVKALRAWVAYLRADVSAGPPSKRSEEADERLMDLYRRALEETEAVLGEEVFPLRIRQLDPEEAAEQNAEIEQLGLDVQTPQPPDAA